MVTYLCSFQIGYRFFLNEPGRVEVRLTPPNRVLRPAPTAPGVCVRDTPHRFSGLPRLKTARKRRPKKRPPARTTRFCSGSHGVHPVLCFDFINYPILSIYMCTRFCILGRPVDPFLFTRKRTSRHTPARKIPHNRQVAQEMMRPQHGRITDDPQRSAATQASKLPVPKPHQ